MKEIFLNTIKDRKISLFIYCISGIALLWMYVALFPYVQGQAEEYAGLVEGLPVELQTIFGIDDFNLDTLEKFLQLEQFALMLAIMIVFLGASIAGSSISGEIDKGTIEMILSKPVSRIKIFTAKFLAGAVSLTIFSYTSIFFIFPLALFHGVDIQPASYVYLATMSLGFGIAVLSMAMLFSSIFSDRGKTYMTVGVTLGVMYVAFLASLLVENLDFVKYFSLFYYFDSSKALIGLELNLSGLGVFAVVSLVFAILGALVFNKRDIAV